MKGKRDALSEDQLAFYSDTLPTGRGKEDSDDQAGERIHRGDPEELSTEDLRAILVGMKIRLDCGHCATPGHNFANTIIIVSLGGGRIETSCSECGY